MSNIANWLSPEVLRTLGWTLLHFLWQGAGLAALFAVAAGAYRSASARYALAVCAGVFVVVSPVLTFTWLRTAAHLAFLTRAYQALEFVGTPTPYATSRPTCPA